MQRSGADSKQIWGGENFGRIKKGNKGCRYRNGKDVGLGNAGVLEKEGD